MNHQAQGLEQLSNSSALKVIAVTSGKGGVGKTNVSVNIAVSLAQQGCSVLLFDADLGLANVDVALGLKPKFDISHVISGERTLEEVLMEGPAGIRIIPASSGITSLTSLSSQQQAGLIRAFAELTIPVDVMIVDTAAGIDRTVLSFVSACQDIIVVICDEPTSITDAYALIKVLSKECGVKRFQLLANMIDNDEQGRQLFDKICRVADRFLDIHLGYIGGIPRDDYLRKAVQRQSAVIELFPQSSSAQALAKVAKRIGAEAGSNQVNSGLGFFVERLIHYDGLELENY